MNLELIKEWVDALRSGKYEQGRLRLRNLKKQYCCLGVLCDIAKDKLEIDWKFKHGQYYIDDNDVALPISVVSLIGIGLGHRGIVVDTTKISPNLRVGIPSDIKMTSLMELNDYYKLSFTQIADILEQQYLM